MSYDFSDRDREILRILISDYIATALPVGSTAIAKKYPWHLSPATIRNVMADLTDMGLLSQPHTSAGRIPTTAAFRFYVDCLLKRRDLSESEMEAIRDKCSDREEGVASVLRKASTILAAASKYVGLVVTPGRERISFKRIEFIPLSERRILGIFVSQEGLVENRLIDVGEELNHIELEKIVNYCNRCFTGLSLEESIEKVERELAAGQSDYDILLKKAMLFSRELFSDIGSEDVVIEGEEHLISEPEFSGARQFRALVDALHEKRNVLKMMERCRSSENVQIYVGSDADLEGVSPMGFVGAPYIKDGKVIGTIGVIGPIRMDYESVVPVVDFTAKVLGDALDI